MIDQKLAAHVAMLGEMALRLLCNFLHAASLVIAGKKRERGTLRAILSSFLPGRLDEVEGNRFQQAVFRKHLAVEELHRVFVCRLRLVGQAGVEPAEVLFRPWIGGNLHVAGVGGDVEEGQLENSVAVVAGDVLGDGVVHVLVGLVLQLHRDDGQAVEKEAEVWALRPFDDQLRDEGDPVLAVKLVGDALAGARLGEIEFEVVSAHTQAGADD